MDDLGDLGVLIRLPRRQRRRRETALLPPDGAATAYAPADGRWLADILATWVERAPADGPRQQHAIAE